MKTKIIQAKKPKNTSLFSDRVKIFSKDVEKLSGKKRKPAEYTIVEIPTFIDAPQLTPPQSQQFAVCSVYQNF